jgi:hypothetical protein
LWALIWFRRYLTSSIAAQFNHFRGLTKMVLDSLANRPTCDLRSPNRRLKILPTIIFQQCLQITRRPELVAVTIKLGRSVPRYVKITDFEFLSKALK